MWNNPPWALGFWQGKIYYQDMISIHSIWLGVLHDYQVNLQILWDMEVIILLLRQARRYIVTFPESNTVTHFLSFLYQEKGGEWLQQSPGAPHHLTWWAFLWHNGILTVNKMITLFSNGVRSPGTHYNPHIYELSKCLMNCFVLRYHSALWRSCLGSWFTPTSWPFCWVITGLQSAQLNRHIHW